MNNVSYAMIYKCIDLNMKNWKRNCNIKTSELINYLFLKTLLASHYSNVAADACLYSRGQHK